MHRISAEIGRYFATGRLSGAPESIELIEPVFYRGMQAFAVGRLIGDGVDHAAGAGLHQSCTRACRSTP